LQILASKGSKDDLFVIMDSDAFPISEWQERVLGYLKDNEFVAVQRLENPLNPEIAHPCFCAWHTGTDIQFGINKHYNPYIVGWEDRKWKRLNRTNLVNLHKQLYGIYDNFIYHHGAGSRDVTNDWFFKFGLERFDEIFDRPHEFIKMLGGKND
jgi:hypothetical protein